MASPPSYFPSMDKHQINICSPDTVLFIKNAVSFSVTDEEKVIGVKHRKLELHESKSRKVGAAIISYLLFSVTKGFVLTCHVTQVPQESFKKDTKDSGSTQVGCLEAITSKYSNQDFHRIHVQTERAAHSECAQTCVNGRTFCSVTAWHTLYRAHHAMKINTQQMDF